MCDALENNKFDQAHEERKTADQAHADRIAAEAKFMASKKPSHMVGQTALTIPATPLWSHPSER